jgi:4-amino-4-deoxy-L-arabinose transferase-like glycosyltransferase
VQCGGVALQQMHGTIAAIAAPGMMLTVPRLFTEAHFATQDGQLAACWLMLWTADASAARRRRTAVLTGVLLGLTASTKFTAWLAVGPLTIAAIRRREGCRLATCRRDIDKSLTLRCRNVFTDK